MSLRRLSSIVLVGIALLGTLVVVGCAKPVANPKLLIGKWSVSKYRDTSGNMVRPEAAGFSRGLMTLRFIDDARLSGDSGASTFGAGYSAQEDGSISIGSINSAKSAVSQADAIGQEQDLFNDLAQARSYTLTPSSLVLLGAAHQSLVRFSRN